MKVQILYSSTFISEVVLRNCLGKPVFMGEADRPVLDIQGGDDGDVERLRQMGINVEKLPEHPGH